MNSENIQQLNSEQQADCGKSSQNFGNTPVSGGRRHKWEKIISDDGNYSVCQHCGIKKLNVVMGYGKNGHAALYILKGGERTSYRPNCK